ncbi:MAG: DUF1302 family protein [Pseudomonadota bacterium]
MKNKTKKALLCVAASLWLVVGGGVRVAHADEPTGGAGADFMASPSAEGGTKGPSFWSKLRLTGYLKNETAFRVREPRSITKIRNIAYLNAQYPFSSNVKFNYTGWAYYDLAYDLFDYRTIAARSERNVREPLVFVETLDQEKDSPVAATRELYFDLFLKNLDIRVGKQYVVWGVLEGVRITDEINPLDFRELILPDLLDFRIPLWTLKMDHYRGNTAFQFLWIPDIKFHKPAPRGSEWELLQEIRDDRGNVLTKYPKSFALENSEIGLKASTNVWDTELSMSYFYTWDDYPVIFRSIDLRPSTTPLNPMLFPTYTRISMYGGTAVKQVGPVIVKGEAAYVTGKYFGLKNTVDRNGDGFLDNEGELKRDHIRWGLGLDFNVLGMDISPIFTQWVILKYDPELIQSRNDSSFSIFGRKEFPRYSATAQFLWIYLINMRESLLKPKVTYQVTDKLQVGVGMDIFWGKSGFFGDPGGGTSFLVAATQQRPQFFGNFHNNDRIYMEFKYSF